MEIKVLGPLEASEKGASITPSAGKPRQLLALLGLRAGHVVTVPALIEELWGATPPRSALTTLQTYVLQIRRRIEAAGTGAAKDVLVTRYGGYLLDAGDGYVDVAHYERLAGQGQRALEEGDLEAASRLLRSALEVWRGPVLSDVPTGTRLAMEVTRLEESRLGALEAQIDADLRLGRHQALLGDLSMLTAQHPLHENFCAQHMLALYRSGRPSRALEAYRTLRDRLVDELGLGPSDRLRGLQRAILRADPNLTPVPQLAG
ncbi:AfsR/SARP family transcriptional regulator [Umezawaea tangerina]|uniref:DNA-binding SARP family transcriptional activator n=1 Tax=Umezawaea tangerina TaxID=84725 RepID=A0A2T0THT4_9PSEU|nr:BTAD domain-containing putative transcriptional regulator [Umezawaea tangerina]PRY45179.1 DNA-binding SARP family transcriptional activator [Umezawaea tangerina]